MKSMFSKSIIIKFFPPIVFEVFRFFRGKEKINRSKVNNELWQGEYDSWKTALSKCNGYHDEIILRKVRDSVAKVKRGEAVFERDSVLFDKIQYSWPLLACLENVALNKNNKLHVIDFGGSLGSTFFQTRNFLQGVSSLKWIVVEQKHFVDCGKAEFEDAFLKFENSIEDALKGNDVYCLLLSGVLQYLSEPFEWVNKLCNYNIEYILLDRVGFIKRNERILTVQIVPPEIYEASYPCWFFNEPELLEKFTSNYQMITDFNDWSTPPIKIEGTDRYWKGFFLKKKTNAQT